MGCHTHGGCCGEDRCHHGAEVREGLAGGHGHQEQQGMPHHKMGGGLSTRVLPAPIVGDGGYALAVGLSLSG